MRLFIALFLSLILLGCDTNTGTLCLDDSGSSFSDVLQKLERDEAPKESKPDPLPEIERRLGSAESGISHLILENSALKAQLALIKPCTCGDRTSEDAANSQQSLEIEQLKEAVKLQTDHFAKLESAIAETTAAVKQMRSAEQAKQAAEPAKAKTKVLKQFQVCTPRGCYYENRWVEE